MAQRANTTFTLYPVENGDPFVPETLPLTGGPVILGRYLFKDRLRETPFKAVSRKHAEVWVDNDKLWIRDLHSANGTYVNSKNISHLTTPWPLVSGDIIQLGRIVDAENGTYHRKIVARVEYGTNDQEDSDAFSESWDAETVRPAPQGSGPDDSSESLPQPDRRIAPSGASSSRSSAIQDWRLSFTESLETLDSTVFEGSVWIPQHDLVQDEVDGTARRVGYGGLSDIYRGTLALHTSPRSTIKVAIKRLRVGVRSLDRAIQALRREVRVWQDLTHPNILPFYGLFITGLENALPGMVSPWCERGHIIDYLASLGEHPEIAFVKLLLLHDVIYGLEYLHKKIDPKSSEPKKDSGVKIEHSNHGIDHGDVNHKRNERPKPSIIHGDLKGANILISDDGRAQLCDFGLSNIMADHTAESSNPSSGIKGTCRFMAPELFASDDARTTTQSDIWAYGCVILQVISGKAPYYTKPRDPQVIWALARAELPERPPNVPDDFWNIALECWRVDPSRRPTATGLVPKINGLGLREFVGVAGGLKGSTVRSTIL